MRYFHHAPNIDWIIIGKREIGGTLGHKISNYDGICVEHWILEPAVSASRRQKVSQLHISCVVALLTPAAALTWSLRPPR